MKTPRRLAAVCCALCASVSFVSATDYYVSPDGGDANNGLDPSNPFLTIDAAITAATSGDDVIHVAAGTYSTTTQWGPNLKAKLVGEGATRDDVVIQSAGTYRTLRMAAGSWVENVTIVGEGTWQADKGGAIEMSGGTITNCVVRDGTAKANGNTAGGNIYVNNVDALITDCEIYGGSATNRGGNVYLDRGLISNCTIYNGTCPNNIGGNVYQYQGMMSNCVIYAGTAKNDGGNVRMNGSGTMVDCVISNGTVEASDKKGANVYMDSSAKMTRCHLVGGVNTAAYNGGSLCVYSSSASVEDCLIEGSECGGVLLGATSYLYNCTIVNNKYGCWAWSNNQHFFNVVIYGNESEWNGNLPNNASAEFVSCASSGSARIVTDGDFGVTTITDSAFVNYANGDYRPAIGSALIDAGTADPRGASASTTDLAGKLRTSGTIDIGCYEFQKSDVVVHIDSGTYDQTFAPATVTFTHSTDNSASPENVVFTYDFGDGSAAESTSALTISHTYTTPGVYTVKITAVNECDEEAAEMTYNGYVSVASSIVYVTPGNSAAGTFPYNTPEKGFGNLKTAVQNAQNGYTLLLGEGVHETVDQVSFNKAITIRGLGATPDAVVVSNTTANPNTYYHRTMEMNNANGRIENITIANGCVKNQFGGNLRLVTGVVSNCVIRGGLAVADNGNAGGAGVELAGAGTLTHCIISNNVVQGSSNSGSYAGGAVAVQYNAKNGRISNCLIVLNHYVTSGDTVKAGAAGIRFCGSNDNTQIENNTIAANVVEGSLADDSAGVYCTTWYGRLRNNIIVGNYETGKEKYTSVRMDTDHGTFVNNLTDADATPASVFKKFAANDFRPNASGEAYNAGTDALTLLPSVDLAGKPRVKFDKIDIGCYECQSQACTLVLFR